MGEPGVQDLLAIDRDVARGVALLTDWRATLARDPAACAGDEPLDAVRAVTGKSTWEALGRLDVSVAERPLCEALRRWVYYLLQARVGRVEETAWARVAAEPRSVVEGSERRLVNWRGAWQGVLSAATPSEAGTWLDAAADLAPPLAAVAARRSARRVEVARRMGFEHMWAPLVDAAPGALKAAAARFFDGTDDVWSATFGDVLRGGTGATGVIHVALARDAGRGWPARLTARWLHDVLGEAFVGPALEIPALPTAIGAASFARALGAFGFAVRATPSSASLPFALVREPAFVAAHRLSHVVGSLAAEPAFQVRALGLGRATAAAQARQLAATALFDARLLALRVLLGDDAAPAPRDLFEELTARMFGRTLDPRLRAAWPAPREDEPARWLAALEAPRFRDALRERFDADWFRNPRAWQEIRGAQFAREPVGEEVVRDGADDLSRAFERALG